VYGGLSAHVLSGGYLGGCPCDFVASGSGWSTPFGASLNIPVFSDAAIYLRLGLHQTTTDMFSGRFDSLRSARDAGSIGSDLRLQFDLVNFDVLLRLIGRQDGERVFTGLSFGFVRNTHVRLTDTEYGTGATYIIEDKALEEARNMYAFFVIGVEYAFIPLRNLYLIPSMEINYSLNKIMKDVPPRPTYAMRPIFYKILLTAAVQIF
jgi:hypothetical protein